MIRYAIIALVWTVVFVAIAALIAFVGRRRHQRKKRVYDQNFAGMGLNDPEVEGARPDADDS